MPFWADTVMITMYRCREQKLIQSRQNKKEIREIKMREYPKIVLTAVNAKYIHSNPAIYSLRAYQRKYAPQYSDMVELSSYTINHQEGEILADLYKKKPDVVAFSCYIWNISMIHRLIIELKKILPKADIWLGGPEVTFDAAEQLKVYSQLTGIMLGEGEQTFLELCGYYAGEKELKDIAGIVYRDANGNVVCTKERALTRLTDIPFLYDRPEEFTNRIIYYESSRGCPFRCSYCLSSIDKTVRLRDLEVVLWELQFFLDQKVAQVKFVDRTFNCNKQHALTIWKYLLEHDNGVTNFHFEVAADILDEEELQILNRFRPGAVQLEIGVQSTNPVTIKEIDRVMDVEKLKKILARIREGHNIHMHLDLIAGLPYEDIDSFAHSFNEVYAMEPEQLQLGFLKVLKGSKMHQNAESYGICYTSEPPYEVLYTKWLSYEDVLRLKQVEEMVELYYNSNQFTYTLPILLREFDTPYGMFEALAQFYEKEGYFIETPARSYRYRVLLQFACQIVPEKETLFQELLTMDIYLRENAKSRPAFALPQDAYKERIRAFYQKEMKEHTTLEGYEEYDARQLARMTHIEVFGYDPKNGTKLANPCFILYDYKHRNPLTFEAKTYVIEDKLEIK